MATLKKILLIGLAIRVLFVLVFEYHVDIFNHVDWGIKLWQYGPRGFYEQIFWRLSWPNQPLGSMILFGLIAKLNQAAFAVLLWLNAKIALFPSFIFPFLDKKLHIILLKLPFILADLGIGWLIYQIVINLTKVKKKALLAATLFVFNPITFYNSAIWGQTDSLTNFLGLLGLWLLYRKKYFPGFLAFLATLYFKLSLVIWLPVVGLILLPYFKEVKKIIPSFLAAVAIFIVITLPFVHHGNVFSWLWYLYTNRVIVRQGGMLSGNAFNFWSLVYGINLGLNEGMEFLGLTAKLWGYLLTIVAFAFSTLVFLRKKVKDWSSFCWLMILYSLGAFLFLTNMHERYLFPLFAPAAILVALKKLDWRWYVALTAIHLTNLYNLWWYPTKIFQGLLEYSDFLVPRILSGALIVIFGLMLLAYNKRNEKR